MLTKEGVVIIKGKPGSGKTCTTIELAYELNNRRKKQDVDMENMKAQFLTTADSIYTVIKHTDWKDVDIENMQAKGTTENILVVLEDCFGRFTSSEKDIQPCSQKLNTLIEIIKHSEVSNLKAIITVRRDVSALVRKNIICADNVVDLDELKNEDKKQMFEYINTYHNKAQLSDISCDSFQNSCVGWPLLCKLVLSMDIHNVTKLCGHPLDTLEVIFDRMKRNNSSLYFALVYIMLNDGYSAEKELNVEMLQQILEQSSNHKQTKNNNTLQLNRDELIQIIKKYSEYIDESGDEYKICHDVVLLALLHYYYRSNPIVCIQFCHLKFLAELLRPEGYRSGLDEHSVSAFWQQGDTSSCENDYAQDENKSANIEQKYDVLSSYETKKTRSSDWKFVIPKEHYQRFIDRLRDEDQLELFASNPLMDDPNFKTLCQKKPELRKCSLQ